MLNEHNQPEIQESQSVCSDQCFPHKSQMHTGFRILENIIAMLCFAENLEF